MKTLLLLSLFFTVSLASGQVPYIQRSTITSGTLTIADTGTDVIVIHEAVLVVNMTIALPATPFDGQRVTISSVGGITTLTLTAPLGTIVNTIATLIAGGNASYMYSSSQSKWYKIR